MILPSAGSALGAINVQVFSVSHSEAIWQFIEFVVDSLVAFLA